MIFETFAERKRQQGRNDEPDIYMYDSAPQQFRHQLCMAICEGIGRYHIYSEAAFNDVSEANDLWREVDKICRKEIFSFNSFGRHPNLRSRYCHYIMRETNVVDLLSVVEVACVALTIVDSHYNNTDPSHRGAEQTGTEAIEEINYRFRQHALGYQFEGKQLIRVDSSLHHAEVVKPTLRLLMQPIFVKANEEFMRAHRNFRSNELKDCITSAHRAFECMLKAICDSESWAYSPGDRAAELISKVTNNGLFTHKFDRGLSTYVAMLKTGLPEVRNEAGGHGEGIVAPIVTTHIARFALNLTATYLLFVGDSYETFKNP